MNIDFRKLILELSDDSFIRLKTLLDPYIWNYFVDIDEVTKEMELEKIGEYLKAFELSSKLRDNDFAKKYTDILHLYIDNRIVPAKKGEIPCKAEKYFGRAKEIQKNITTCESSDVLLTYLEDYTKIFLCLYRECIKDIETQITDLEFHVTDIDFKNLIAFYMKDTPSQWKIEQKAPEQLRKVIPTRFLKGADGVKKGINDMQKGIQDAHKDFGDQLKKMMKKEDTIIEPVHDFIEYVEGKDIYSEKAFSSILLTIFFLRIKDYEMGLAEVK